MEEKDIQEELERIKELRKKNNRKRICRFEPWELSFIKANCRTLTDKQIAEELNRQTVAIARQRKKLNLHKDVGRPNKDVRTEEEIRSQEFEIVKEEYKNLTRDQKRKLFEARFKKSKRYDQILQTLQEDEIDFFAERWLDYINTWETLLSTEEDQLYLAIMELIRANRILVRQKDAMDNEADDENHVPMEMFERQYKDCVESYNKLMNNLSGTRQQRLAVEKEDKISIITIVQKLQDVETRKKAGTEAAIIAEATRMTADGMRQLNYLID